MLILISVTGIMPVIWSCKVDYDGIVCPFYKYKQPVSYLIIYTIFYERRKNIHF